MAAPASVKLQVEAKMLEMDAAFADAMRITQDLDVGLTLLSCVGWMYLDVLILLVTVSIMWQVVLPSIMICIVTTAIKKLVHTLAVTLLCTLVIPSLLIY